jgi:glycosyltransferase involved in cell wall biosynthesis
MILSIVIPTFNEEKLLPILLQSIKTQSFTDYEIIVADNNSTDKTVEIATSYDAKVVPGGMPGRGRNSGASHATGDILLFLDADVILSYGCFLANVMAEFQEKEYDVATCQIHPISTSKVDLTLHQSYNLFMLATAKFMPHAPGFCILANRQLHNQINGFDEEIKLAEDSDYVQRADKVGKFGLLSSQKIHVSVRRMDRDGRINILFKYVLAGLHMYLLGNIKSDIFKYSFGHDPPIRK